LFIVAGEHSGDRLGGKLLAALQDVLGARLEMQGVGGEDMEAEGLNSLFPMADVAVMGPVAIAKRLPHLLRRVRETAEAAIAFAPDVVVIIDSPEFTHRIARRIRKARPDIPIIDYVSPTVWAWRPGRAKRMAAYVDHLLALLPFEPDVHKELQGPVCTYVGHPLIERADFIASCDPLALSTRLGLDPAKPVLVLLPGSRPNEVQTLAPVFGGALQTLANRIGPYEVVLPVASSVRELVEAEVARWHQAVHIVSTEADKFAAFRLARAALAASGTVTLELAMAGTPMVVAYRVDRIAYHVLKRLIRTPSIVLANLVLGRSVFPEFIQKQVTAEALSDALAGIMVDGPARQVQLEALAAIAELMAPPASSPSVAAAEIVLRHALGGRRSALRDQL
jgi:lipid-A-disaccharide synthase